MGSKAPMRKQYKRAVIIEMCRRGEGSASAGGREGRRGGGVAEGAGRTRVDSVGSEDSSRAERSPEDGCGEEGVLGVADESVLLVGLADVGDRHLVVEDGGRDEAGDDGTAKSDRRGKKVSKTDTEGKI